MDAKKKQNKRKKVEEMKQADGRIAQKKPMTLDQLWRDTGLHKYGTMDLEEYQEKLSDMNKSDLQTHAITVGIVPNDDRNRLIKNLISEFKRFVNGYLYQQPEISASENNKNPSKKVLKILAEGR